MTVILDEMQLLILVVGVIQIFVMIWRHKR